MSAIGVGIRIKEDLVGQQMQFPEEGTRLDFKRAVLDEVYNAYCAFCGWPDVSTQEDTVLMGCHHCPPDSSDPAYDNRRRQLLRDQDLLDE